MRCVLAGFFLFPMQDPFFTRARNYRVETQAIKRANDEGKKWQLGVCVCKNFPFPYPQFLLNRQSLRGFFVLLKCERSYLWLRLRVTLLTLNIWVSPSPFLMRCPTYVLFLAARQVKNSFKYGKGHSSTCERKNFSRPQEMAPSIKRIILCSFCSTQRKFTRWQ